MNQTTLWIGFGAIIAIMLVLDLGFLNRKSHVVHFKEALLWCAAWILVAMLFNLGVWQTRGPDAALKFATGYLLELSLSVDNLFVFILLFGYFRVPSEHQHSVLFWGILGAMIMRMLFIVTGVALIHRFEWIIYVFGAFLVYTGYKLAVEKDKEVHPEKNPILKLFRKLFTVTPDYHGHKFLVRQENKIHATPLLIVLLMIETTDVIFAIDSIPAILAITTDPFIVYTSNIFAILGLRSLYFALSGMMKAFHYLNYGLAIILSFIGVKMLLSMKFKMPIQYALGFILFTLTVSIILSLMFPKKEEV